MISADDHFINALREFLGFEPLYYEPPTKSDPGPTLSYKHRSFTVDGNFRTPSGVLSDDD